MANKYPYVPSAGPLLKTIKHLRRTFPKDVTAETLRKLGVAPKNESYVINVLRFVGIIDDEGKRVPAKSTAFSQHQDDRFAAEFGTGVKEAYGELFELHGDDAWTLDRGALTQFFRETDHTSDVVGSRQAAAFSALAALSGHAELPTEKPANSGAKPKPAARAPKAAIPRDAPEVIHPPKPGSGGAGAVAQEVGLTVRIEVNLPASGDQETYDRIFKSIKTNLLGGS